MLELKLLLRSGSAPSAGSSLSGASTSGAPLRQRPISFAATSSCSSGVWPCCFQKVAKRADMFLQTAIRHETAVARKDLRLRLLNGGAVFIRVAEYEFARLQRRAGAGRRLFAGAFDGRLGEPVAVAEMIVSIIERRRRLQIERRQHLHAFAPRDELLVLGAAALAFGGIAGEEDDDGVQVRAGQTADPVVGVIRAGIAEHLRAGRHALPELLRKRGERGFVHAERAQAVPGECHGHPALVRDRRKHAWLRPNAPCPECRPATRVRLPGLRNDRNS